MRKYQFSSMQQSACMPFPAGPCLIRCGLIATALLLAALCSPHASAASAAPATGSHDAGSLRAKYEALLPQLQNNQFKRPLVLDSTEASDGITGDIYAVLDHPFASVNTAFNGPANWCDMLILHLNTKYCHATTENGAPMLQLRIGKKHDQPLDDAYRVDFKYAVAASTPDYFDVVLSAKDGPMSTRDYRIILESVALPDGRTFMHLTYSYSYGIAARIAMQAYLGTIGSGKVGFTRTDAGGNATPSYIGGVRGVVERNTMRYYLALDAYLSATATKPAEQLEQRLQAWFNATERFPRQLHEVERSAYLEMKRSEYKRQQSAR